MKKEKTIKYSDLKKRLKLQITGKGGDAAALTHYLQTRPNGASKYYRKGAGEFFRNSQDILSLLEEPGMPQLSLPIDWDIPFPPNKNAKFSFIDLFAGIGGIRLAFQNLGGKCVFTSEWDKYAQVTYEANFGEVPFGDITKIDPKSIPDHDVLLGGFPCQPFSLAGVSKKNSLGRAHGFQDETQGTLFFNIKEIIKAKKPKVFLLENVKNLVSHDKGKTFEVISSTLKKLGYSIYFKVLDARNFVPQHRERIFIVGFSNKVFRHKEDFAFPDKKDNTHRIADILERSPEERFTLSDHLWKYLRDYAEKHREMGNGFGFGLVDQEGVSRTLSARYHKDGSEILIPQKGKNPRRLTPRECARLMGYPEHFIIPVSDTQAYRQFGNSVVVPLVEAIGKRVIGELDKFNG